MHVEDLGSAVAWRCCRSPLTALGLMLALGATLSLSGCRAAFQRGAGVTETTVDVNDPSSATLAPWKPITFVDDSRLRSGVGSTDEDADLTFAKTASGLQYRVLRQSSRPKPTAADTVTVHYRGWLSSGKVFDSSYENGDPTTFALRNVVAGWTEGLQLVGEGGMIELWVPSRLGYGAAGSPGSIPPHSDLHFIVELKEIR